MTLSEDKKELIEKIGVFHEKLGMQPAAGRVMGLLFVSDQPELTFDEIRETLQLSKSATSNALKLLLETGPVEYITLPGDRKRYFRLKTSNWRDSLSKRFDNIINFKVLLKQVYDVREDKASEFGLCLEEFIEFLDYMQQELPNLLKKWESSKKR